MEKDNSVMLVYEVQERYRRRTCRGRAAPRRGRRARARLAAASALRRTPPPPPCAAPPAHAPHAHAHAHAYALTLTCHTIVMSNAAAGPFNVQTGRSLLRSRSHSPALRQL
jgi:hypothetical protein